MTGAIAPDAIAPGAGVRGRIDAVDLLRGLVMVIMALDHTREFVHGDALRFDPTDFTQASPLLFFTRWVTHYCAPIFVFLAGTSAWLLKTRGRTTAELSIFLLTRGVWLVALELSVIKALVWFNIDPSFLALLQVIWVIGIGMIVLAGLVHLPMPAVGAFGLLMIAGHNALDGVQVATWAGPGTPAPGAWAQAWIVLHQGGGMLPVFGGASTVWVLYPLIPWIGVMAAGYAFGRVYGLPTEARQRLLVRGGLLLVAAFVLLRASNVYGDPSDWAPQATAMTTLLSFLRVSKYPPSLLFLLMTLGPAMLALAWFERHEARNAFGRAMVTFGRVPLFFYVLQWLFAHGAAVLLTMAAGKPVAYLFQNPPAFFTMAPPDAGFSLAATYACWTTIIVILYFCCRWYAGIKARRRDWWLSYL